MKKIFALLFAIFIILNSISAFADAPDIKASSAVLATLSGSQTVYSKDPDKRLPPAEFTKLMTAYTAYKAYGADAVITVPENLSEFTNSMETNMNLRAGEEISVSSLMYGMLMGQANDAAYTVALRYGGVEEYVERMNGLAKVLGMEDTNFTNITGRNDGGQYTTANDLLKLYRAYYNDKKLYEFVSQKSVTLPATNQHPERTYWTKNHLMSRYIYLDYVYDYAKSGVSSSSSNSGYGVISSAEKGTKTLVTIILNSEYENGVNYSMTDAQELFNYGFDEFSTVTIVKQGGLLHEARLKNQKGADTLLLSSDRTLKGLILDEDKEKLDESQLLGKKDKDAEPIKREIIIDEPVSAPIEKGAVVGKAVYTYRGNIVGEVNLIAEDEVKRGILRTIGSGIAWFFNLKAVKLILLIIVSLIAIYIALVVNTIKKSKNKKRRKSRSSTRR